MKQQFLSGFFYATLLLLMACSHSPDKKNTLVIDTQYGEIICELYPEKAPKSCAAFSAYIDSGFYKRSSFYRVLSEENQPMGSAPATLIQGGIFASQNQRSYLKGIPHEPTSQTGLSHKNGCLSLARADTGTATTEFFICLGDQPGFDAGGENNIDPFGYAVFGQVIEGMDVVRKIYTRPEYNQRFTPPVLIYSIAWK